MKKIKVLNYTLLSFLTILVASLFLQPSNVYAVNYDLHFEEYVNEQEFNMNLVESITVNYTHLWGDIEWKNGDNLFFASDESPDMIITNHIDVIISVRSYEQSYIDVLVEKNSIIHVYVGHTNFWVDINDGEKVLSYTDEISYDSLPYLIINNVFDNKVPAISGQENFVTNVDDAKPISFFQNYLSAWDETDGDLTDSIYIVSDNYTTNKHVLGTYSVVFGVQDLSENESTLEVFITVADVTKPVIAGNTTTAKISYTQTWNIETFRKSLAVTDNYATMTNSDIEVESDGYTSKKTDLGIYDVVFKATDPSGNTGTFTKKVEVIDDIAPVFSGPTTLNKPNNSILTVNDIKAQLTATDAKEGNKTSEITVVEDNFTGYGHITGTYTVKFKVSDSKDNTSYHTVTIKVQDNIPPVWYIQDGVSIKLVPPVTLTRQQIIDLLVNTGQLQVGSTTQITFSVDEYTGNEETPGVYLMTLNYKNTSGNEGVHNLTITVLDGEDETPIIVDPSSDFFGWIKAHPFETTLILILAALIILGIYSSTKKQNKRSRR